VDAAMVDGRLRITWSFSGARHKPQTIEALSTVFLERLDQIVAHCLSADAGGVTPCDFPLAQLDQATLDRLLGSGRDIQDVYPLSPLQQGLLFHSLWEPGSGVYVEQVSATLEGQLDVAAFRRAWELIIARHDALRTTFLSAGVNEPLQVVSRTADLELTLEDWRTLDAEQQSATLKERLRTDRTRGFELNRGPLFRVSIFRVADNRQLVLLTHHHLILDGWSAALILRDAFSSYEAARTGTTQALPPALPYREYIAWLQERDLRAAEAYFRTLLAGFSEPTELPFVRAPRQGERTDGDPDASGSEAASARYAARAVALSPSLSARLETYAQRQRVTLNTLVSAAWAFVLGRAAGRDDVVFGVTTCGRSAPLPGIEGAVGLFINTLPLRVAIPASEVVSDWLRAVGERVSELGQYEHTPLAQVRAWSAVPGRQPLFESLLVFENYPADARVREGLPGLGVRDIAFADQTNYPLTLSVLPGTELALRLAYERARVEDEDAARLLTLLQDTLKQLLENAERSVGELALLGELDAASVTALCHGPTVTHPEVASVLTLIERVAAVYPERDAILFEEQRVSYRELNRRANQLADFLIKRGVGPDVHVAIAAERSIELVVGLLGIMKTGASYVPVDPDYPRARVAFMLDDAAAPVLVSQWPVAARLPAHRAELVCLDADRAQIECGSVENPRVPIEADSLAYTIYTSGSTGSPKGAGNTHRGLLNRLAWMQAQFELTSSDRVLQKTPFSFDVSVWEFFWPLMVGATLVVVRPGDHRDAERLWKLISQHCVTTLHFVPPMLEAFLECEGLVQSSSLRRVICSGEALSAELARRCLSRLDVELHNLYGPTEASIDVTAWTCLRDSPSPSVPIGRPIANTQVYVLDRACQLLPPGVPGELYIGGVGVARGYHRRAALTAERFVPDPFGVVPGARLYRTGDLARLRADGALEFLGRLDHQVKIRGFRVELGEIEACLLKHPGVREAVVTSRRAPHGGQRLAAYVSGSSPLVPEELRSWLARDLPEYMVPSIIYVLERLPLSPNGKVERSALPVPEASGEGKRSYEAPRNDAEAILAEVWAEVMHLGPVGVHDDFFALGGDSIVALQVLTRAGKRGVKLTPKLLFEYPTIAQVAPHAELASTVAPAAPEQPAAADEAAQLSDDEWRGLLDEIER
jgi:amino acid adenylation domain-containing protein